MIEPMKKITVVCLAAERRTTIEQLAALGIVHVQPVRMAESEQLKKLLEQREEIEETLAMLPDLPAGRSATATQAATVPSAPDLMAAIHAADRRQTELRKQQKNCQERLQTLQPWGGFDPAALHPLQQRGLELVLFSAPQGSRPALPEGSLLQEISTRDKVSYYAALVARGVSLPMDLIPLPAAGDVAGLEQELRDLDQSQAETRARLLDLAQHRTVLDQVLESLATRIQFCEARDGMGQDGTLAYLQGYVPESLCDPLWQAARRHGWGLLVRDPDAHEKNIPTLLRLPRWVEPVRLIFQGLGVIPGYHEIDISAWFLVFFSLFFAILIGDAGYGAIFLILTLLLRKKFPHAPKAPFWLFGELAVGTIIWGVLTGTYFGWTGGEQSVALIEGLAQETNVQKLCFGLGAIHLILAHLWNALLIGRRARALSELGWVLVFMGNYFLAGKMVLGQEIPNSLLWSLFGPGMAAVVLFSKPSYNPLKAIAGGLGSLAMNIINSFVDLVSYIRLFAVSAATVAVATSFNDMALGLELAPFWKGLAMAVILVLGHGLNILLGAMGVLVHGVRLNMLEFSGHLGMEWAGIPYRPLKKNPEDSP